MSASKPGRIPWRKPLIAAVSLVLSLALLETALRAFYAFKVGPSVMLYGTPLHRHRVQLAPPSGEGGGEAKSYMDRMTRDEWRSSRTVIAHENALAGYSKYFPNQKRVDFDVETGEPFDVTINSHGFRGRDFEQRKAPGVTRVVTLGASSTFGYFNRDGETYPAVLEELLNAGRSGAARFEVVNLGVPHLLAANIHDLFVAEALPLEPDVVTFYEGNNDADLMRLGGRQRSLPRRVLERVGGYLITAGLLDSLLSDTERGPLPPDFEQRAAELGERFVGSLERIRGECAERGILLVVANQQKNSQTLPRRELAGLTYAGELERIRRRYVREGSLTPGELQLLTHEVLMKDLQAWATASQVPFVDVISTLDPDRSVMVSWVHLNPAGNRKVAEALAQRILGELH